MSSAWVARISDRAGMSPRYFVVAVVGQPANMRGATLNSWIIGPQMPGGHPRSSETEASTRGAVRLVNPCGGASRSLGRSSSPHPSIRTTARLTPIVAASAMPPSVSPPCRDSNSLPFSAAETAQIASSTGQHAAKFCQMLFGAVDQRRTPTMLTGHLAGRLIEAYLETRRGQRPYEFVAGFRCGFCSLPEIGFDRCTTTTRVGTNPEHMRAHLSVKGERPR
jgi:hypothetical protein